MIQLLRAQTNNGKLDMEDVDYKKAEPLLQGDLWQTDSRVTPTSEGLPPLGCGQAYDWFPSKEHSTGNGMPRLRLRCRAMLPVLLRDTPSLAGFEEAGCQVVSCHPKGVVWQEDAEGSLQQTASKTPRPTVG